MMIKASSEFEESIKYITEPTGLHVGDITDEMKAAEFNLTFGTLEQNLIDLYEKTRVLEDIKKYCFEYIIKHIQEKRLELAEKLKAIENCTDKLQNTDYVALIVPFKDNALVVYDRDNSILKSCNINSEKIIPGSDIAGQAIITNVIKQQEIANYRDTLENIIETGQYKSYYLTESPVENGIRETIQLMFDELTEINYITTKLINCENIEIKYINEHDEDITFDAIKTMYGPKCLAKGVKITLKTVNYVKTTMRETDSNEKDFWNTLQSNVFNRSQSIKSLYTINKRAKEFTDRQDLENFQHKTEQWMNSKTNSNNKNLLVEAKE